MLSAFSEWLFNTSGLAPHGYCLLWEPGLIWLYAISDAAIALAYYSIPLTLIIIGRRRSDLVFRPMLWLFGDRLDCHDDRALVVPAIFSLLSFDCSNAPGQ